MICLYHHDADGCAAAAVVQLAHPIQDIEFQAVQYGEDPPDVKGGNSMKREMAVVKESGKLGHVVKKENGRVLITFGENEYWFNEDELRKPTPLEVVQWYR